MAPRYVKRVVASYEVAMLGDCGDRAEMPKEGIEGELFEQARRLMPL